MCVKLYEIDLQTDIHPDLYEILSPEEQSFAQMIRNEMLKKQHITVRIGLRQILASGLNQVAEKINISKNIG